MANSLVIELKTCRVCEKDKPITEFSIHSGNNKPRRYCKPCAVKMTQVYQAKRPLHQMKYDLQKKYGISLEQYFTMLENQNSQCAICGSKFSDSRNHRLCVDHDHINGEVRGLLCFNCNTALGKFNDDPDLLKIAIDYLERNLNEQ